MNNWAEYPIISLAPRVIADDAQGCHNQSVPPLDFSHDSVPLMINAAKCGESIPKMSEVVMKDQKEARV